MIEDRSLWYTYMQAYCDFLCIYICLSANAYACMHYVDFLNRSKQILF